MSSDVSVMHSDFPQWMAEFNLGHRDGWGTRWNGVAQVASAAKEHEIEQLLRIALGGRQAPTPVFSEKFREAFRNADPEFPASGERELKVLAGATLAAILGCGKSIAIYAGLATSTASMSGLRQFSLPMSLTGMAENALHDHAELNRQRPDASALLGGRVQIKFDTTALMQPLKDQPNAEAIVNALGQLAKLTNDAVNLLVQGQTKLSSAINSFLRIQDEELQMLWWLIGERSLDLNCKFSEIDRHFLPLALGRELAAMTEVLPGPVSIEGLLSRAGVKVEREIVMAEAIDSSPEDWISSLIVDMEPSPILHPLHFAAKRRAEAGPEAWIKAWAATVGVEPRQTLREVEVGLLFYKESLLLSQWG